MYSVVIVGSGNLATQLAIQLKKNKFLIKQVYSRNLNNAKALASLLNTQFTDNLSKLFDADLIIIATKDSAIEEVLTKINSTSIVHTSGTTSLDIFKNRFKNYGVIYPVQTFKKNIEIDFSKIPICVEASNKSFLSDLISLSKKLSEKVIEIDSHQRKKIHLAAVFSCNFTNYLFTIAYEILENENIDFSILHNLIQKSINNLKTNQTNRIQTGPAQRKDLNIINEHINLMKSKEYKEIYKLITNYIIKRNE